MLELDLVLAIAAGAFVLGLVVGFSIRAYVSARRRRRARGRRELPIPGIYAATQGIVKTD
jgi:hypothetical protein